MTVELELTGMAYGGEALGRDEQGRMLFVPFALDGETVRVQITDEHARWARTRLLEVLKPSDRRISPRCRHFQECGGCHYQHLSHEDQLQIKAEIVKEQLQRLGGFSAPPVLSSIASPEPWNYRSSMRFHLTPQGKLGFMRSDSSSVIPIDECHLPLPALDELWPRLQFEDPQSIEQVSMRVDTQGETMVLFHARLAPSNPVDVDASTSVHWETPDGRLVLAGDPSLEMQVLGKPFRVSAGSFFQVNAGLLPDLVRSVMAAAAVQPGQHAFDLYAGVGLFSLFLAEAGASVTAIEQSEAACSDFVHNLDAYDGIELYEADVGAALSALTSAPDVVLADPPRSGLEGKVVTRLLDLRPARLVYVSCDPATLARDARKLAEGGFTLQSVQPFDMFPQTYHIETVSLFESG
jgi:23S rRNA (uracil1939-C5)-methyltransferase